MADHRLYFEAGTRVFEVHGKPSQNTRWGVWAVHLKQGVRCLQDKEKVLVVDAFIPRWRPLSAMGTSSELEENEPAGPLLGGPENQKEMCAQSAGFIFWYSVSRI